jgi:quercetin dioxygenase-like cupin family protein
VRPAKTFREIRRRTRICYCSEESAIFAGSGHYEQELEPEVAMYYPAGEIKYAEPDRATMCGDGRIEKLDHAPGSPHLRATHVTFVDGAHTKWHYHTGEQLLMPTEGIGFVEFRGLPLLQIRIRDRVFIPIGVWHRHGARKGHSMTHIAVTSGDTVWDASDNCVD